MICQDIEINIDYSQLGMDNGGVQPRLITYVLNNPQQIDINRKRPAVIICPGGGYEYVSERESEPIAIAMNREGLQAFTLHYSVAPARFPVALLELAKAVLIVREHADEWHVDSNKIIVAGFSAGGHLAACLGVFWQESWLSKLLKVKEYQIKPNGLLLCYPVISSGVFSHQGSFRALLGEEYDVELENVSLEKQVGKQVPPTFIWHTNTDDCVSVENALLFAVELKKYNIPLELHIYGCGGHGLALANEETIDISGYGLQKECQNWIEMFSNWVKNSQLFTSVNKSMEP